MTSILPQARTSADPPNTGHETVSIGCLKFKVPLTGMHTLQLSLQVSSSNVEVVQEANVQS
jgi:hypothetical protein